MKRTITILGALAVSMLVAGCGEGPPTPDEIRGISGESPRLEDDSTVYAQTLERSFSAMEDPELPPIEAAIEQADTKAIRGINANWSEAIRLLEQTTPPDDASDAHAELLASMRKLQDWNNRILKASRKGPKPTARVAKQARNSDAARQYGEALEMLSLLGYLPAPDGLTQ